MFGYGIVGILRPIAVWNSEAVYWSNLPIIKTLQALHWDNIDRSKPLRYFWYLCGGMSIYQVIPGYMFPWLSGVSIPCLASQKATGKAASLLTNLFGGAVSNEGLGILSLCLDWQYIRSGTFSLPLKFQIHPAIGLALCTIAMIALYYGNAWDSRSLPFMSTSLRAENGKIYPVKKVFPGGVLDKSTMDKYGIPRLTASFAYGLLMANAAIGALVIHCIVFWGKDIWKSYKNAFNSKHDDPHHAHMAKHYKETPWWWFIAALVISFVLGLIVVVKEDITLPPWAYVVSLLIGIILAPFSVILYSRYGNGIATNNISKMLAGLMIPGRPIGNMYFSIWSHSVIVMAVDLCQSLRMGEYVKVSPRAIFIGQAYGTILGAFINYALMDSVVSKHRVILTDLNGNSFWSGASTQSFNTNTASWALARYMYSPDSRLEMVPIGIAFGAAAVLIHRLIYHFLPKVGRFDISEINVALLIQYTGYIPYNSPRTGTLFTGIVAGFFGQFYLRNYHPTFFRDYMWILGAGLDAGSGFCIFILTIAVMGVAGAPHPFLVWWGNYQDAYPDWCPSSKS